MKRSIAIFAAVALTGCGDTVNSLLDGFLGNNDMSTPGDMTTQPDMAITLYRLPEDTRLNHRLEVTGGVREAECRELVQEFFKARR